MPTGLGSRPTLSCIHPSVPETRPGAPELELARRARWDLAPRSGDAIELKVRDDYARSIRGLGDNESPGIHDHAPAVSRNAAANAALGGCDDERTVFDGAGPEQHFPVIPTGCLGEVGRHCEDRGSGKSQFSIQLGKAEIEADGHAKPQIRFVGRPLQQRNDSLAARSSPGGFAIRRTAIDGDVEQMELYPIHI